MSKHVTTLRRVRAALPVLQTMLTKAGLLQGAAIAGEHLNDLDAAIAALAAPGVGGVPDGFALVRADVVAFLNGEAELEGRWFGEDGPIIGKHRHQFWWRKHLQVDYPATPQEAAPRAAEADWQPIESAPKGRAVLVRYLNRLGNERVIKARYVERFTEESSGDCDEGVDEYDEANDRYTLCAGWWEMIDNWDDFAFVAVNEGEPTHWHPIPSTAALTPPSAKGENSND